jgi:circadian clock protein KaiC
VDFLKTAEITAIFTSLTAGGGTLEANEADVSSLMDTWLLLKTIECGGEMNRALYVLKSRGMNHSNQIREFLLTDNGLQLLDVYLGQDGVLTGSARLSQEGREKAANTSRHQQLASRKRELERKRGIFEARMSMLRGEFEVEQEVLRRSITESNRIDEELLVDRGQMSRSRDADATTTGKASRGTTRKRGNGHV